MKTAKQVYERVINKEILDKLGKGDIDKDIASLKALNQLLWLASPLPLLQFIMDNPSQKKIVKQIEKSINKELDKLDKEDRQSLSKDTSKLKALFNEFGPRAYLLLSDTTKSKMDKVCGKDLIRFVIASYIECRLKEEGVQQMSLKSLVQRDPVFDTRRIR